MGIANKILPHYTYEDWIHWEGRWELIEGHPIAMSPLPTLKHQRVTAALKTEFGIGLKKTGCKNCFTYDPVDYKIAEDTILVPDALIICGAVNKKFLDFPPTLVAEVLSPATMLRDRNTKFELYQQQLIKYYLIIDTDKELVEIYKFANDKYEKAKFDREYTFSLEDGCSITVDFNEIW